MSLSLDFLTSSSLEDKVANSLRCEGLSECAPSTTVVCFFALLVETFPFSLQTSIMTSVVKALISAVCAVLCNFANLCKTGFVLNISERNQILIFKCLVCSRGQYWWSVSSLGSEAPQVVSRTLSPQQSRESLGGFVVLSPSLIAPS